MTQWYSLIMGGAGCLPVKQTDTLVRLLYPYPAFSLTPPQRGIRRTAKFLYSVEPLRQPEKYHDVNFWFF